MDCTYFTTVRPAAYNYPKEGKVKIQREDGTIFEAMIVEKEEKPLGELTGRESRLDAGMNLSQFKKLMANFYKKKEFYDGDKTVWKLGTIILVPVVCIKAARSAIVNE